MKPAPPVKNAVVEALRIVLGANTHLKIFDYADKETFDSLWTLGDVLEDRILIVWSDTAPDSRLFPVNTAAALSPVDWALAYAARRKENPKTWPEVLILDLHPALHRSAPSLAHFRILRPDQFPWMQVMDDASWSLSTIVSWLGTEPAPPRETERKEALALFLAQVRRNLTQSKSAVEDDHHAVANIIGPMVLARPKPEIVRNPTQPKQSDTADHKSALDAILKATDALREEVQPQKTRSLPIEDMKLVLIDDQASHGWGEWLKACVPIGKEKQVKVLSTVKQFKKFLKICHRTPKEPKGKVKDRRFRLRLPACKKDDGAALLLDLRLFTGREEDEKTFFKELVYLIDDWEFTRKEAGLAWDPFTEDDLRAVREWTDDRHAKSTEPNDYALLLTLFPRFLALLDPSLPIIVFSTTLNPTVFEKLKRYGNIYTGLNKNPFAGGVEPIEYLRNNLPTLEAYNRWRTYFRDLENVPVIAPEKSAYAHWEIYIDEAGQVETKGLRVAGLMVGYASEEQAEILHREMEKLCIRWGDKETEDPALWKNRVRWVNPREVPPFRLAKVRNNEKRLLDYQLLDKQLLSGQLLDYQWKSIRDMLCGITKTLPKYSFCLKMERSARVAGAAVELESPRLGDPDSLDNSYFSLLGDVLEAALFDVLGMVNGSDSPTVGIYAGSRLRVIESVPRGPASESWTNSHREDYAVFGVSLHVPPGIGHPSYQALEMDGVLPVVSELLKMRRGHELTKKLGAGKGIVSVAAIPMNQEWKRDTTGKSYFRGGELKSPAFRNLHFVADIMASLSDFQTKDYGVLTDSAFGFGLSPGHANKALFAQCETKGHGFNCLQRISRLLDPEDRNTVGAAWLFFQMDPKVEAIQKMGIFARAVLIRLREALKTDLTGLQLRQLVAVAAKSGAFSLSDQTEALRSSLTELHLEKEKVLKLADEVQQLKGAIQLLERIDVRPLEDNIPARSQVGPPQAEASVQAERDLLSQPGSLAISQPMDSDLAFPNQEARSLSPGGAQSTVPVVPAPAEQPGGGWKIREFAKINTVDFRDLIGKTGFRVKEFKKCVRVFVDMRVPDVDACGFRDPEPQEIKSLFTADGEPKGADYKAPSPPSADNPEGP